MGNNLSHPAGTTAQQQQHSANPDLLHGLPRLPVSLATSTAPDAAAAAVSMPKSNGDNTASTLKCGCLSPGADDPHAAMTPRHSTSSKHSSTSNLVSLSEAAVQDRATDYHAHRSGESSASSSSSSVVSVPSRGFTNDDTIPWHGSPHGSMADLINATDDASGVPDIPSKDRCLQCTVTSAVESAANPANIAAGATGGVAGVDVPVPAGPSAQVGTLMITPKSTGAAERVTWVVPQEQLRQVLASNMTAGGTSADEQACITSPPFAIPCVLDPAATRGATEGVCGSKQVTGKWLLSLQYSPPSVNSNAESCSSAAPSGNNWQLYLHTAAVLATAADDGGAGSCQLPWRLQCCGRVEVTAGSAKVTADADFQATVLQGSQAVALPLSIYLHNPSSSSSSDRCSDTNSNRAHLDSSSSRNSSRDQDHNKAAAGSKQANAVAHLGVADGDSSSEAVVHIVVTFHDLHLKQADTHSPSAADRHQQEQQLQEAELQSAAVKPHLLAGSNSSDASTAATTGVPSSSSSSSSSATPAVFSTTGSTVHADSNAATTAEEQLAPGGDAKSNTKPPVAAAVVAAPTAVPAAAASSGAIVKQLEAVLLSSAPRMLVIDDFFDAATCEGLMQLARDKLVRSRVASGSETPSRTSWSHFFVKDAAKHPLILSAEAQIEALFACPAVRGPFKSLVKAEALQVVKYHKGEFYHEHYDNRADSPLTRAATIIVYLCDTEAGGATSFPRAVMGGWKESTAAAGVDSDWQLPPKVAVGPRGVGIKVFPVRGRALVFWSKRVDGSEDPNSIHAADTVEQGEKWIATRWMKDA